MYSQQIEVIRELVVLTKVGKLVWHKEKHDGYNDNPDSYIAQLQSQTFRVEFIYLARTNEIGADRTLARLGAFFMLIDYCIGTQGFDLICEMLAWCEPEWYNSQLRGYQRLADGLASLKELSRDDL